MKKYSVNPEYPLLKERGLTSVRISEEEIDNFEFVEVKNLFNGEIEGACFFNNQDNDTYFQKLSYCNEVSSAKDKQILIEDSVKPFFATNKITDEDVADIFSDRYASNMHVKDIAKKYNITTAYVYMLTTASQRKNITQPLLDKYFSKTPKQNKQSKQKTVSRNKTIINDDFGEDFLSEKIRKIVRSEIQSMMKVQISDLIK